MVLYCWLWRAGCILQDTYLLYFYHHFYCQRIDFYHRQDDYHNTITRPSTLGKKASNVENVEKLLQIGLFCRNTNVTNNKLLNSRSSRKRHEYLHENPISITCTICTKKFTRKSQLRKHTAKFHPAAVFQEDSKGPKEENESKGALNECPECKAVFKRPSKLAQHMLVHSGLKPYQCDECEKTFARKTNLQLHKRTHTGEKPHACARCGRCFSDVSAFRRHCRTHTGERPYTCGLCGGAFTQASTLYNHKKTCKRKRVNSEDGDIEKMKNKCLLDI